MIDPNTGLPQLPEGYFFRVEQSYSGGQYYYVKIYRKVEKRFLFFWTKTEDREQIFKDLVHPTLTKANVLKSAKNCVQQWENWKVREMDLVGDYPPKKLEF